MLARFLSVFQFFHLIFSLRQAAALAVAGPESVSAAEPAPVLLSRRLRPTKRRRVGRAAGGSAALAATSRGRRGGASGLDRRVILTSVSLNGGEEKGGRGA